MYNIIYTSLPVLFFLLDKDVSEDAVYEYPELYGESQRGEYVFRRFVCVCVCVCVFVCCLCARLTQTFCVCLVRG